MYLFGGTHSAEETEISFSGAAKDFILTAEPDATTVKKTVSAVSGDAVFSTEAKSLSVSKIDFILSTESGKVLTVPLFFVTVGSFSLTDVTIASDDEDNGIPLTKPALKMGGTFTATITKCSFEGLSLPSGRGSAIYAEMNGDASLSITGSRQAGKKTFSKCSSESNGGAVYVSTGARGVFTVDAISFEECTVASGTGAVVYM